MKKKPTARRGEKKQTPVPGQICGAPGVPNPAPKGREPGTASATPQRTWTRYADSRLRQFCLR